MASLTPDSMWARGGYQPQTVDLRLASAQGGPGSMTQQGEEITATIDGTVASQMNAPAAWVTVPILDPTDRAIEEAIDSLIAEIHVEQEGPPSSDMRFAVGICDDADLTAAAKWLGCAVAWNGAAGDPDVSAASVATAEAANGAPGLEWGRVVFRFRTPASAGYNRPDRLAIDGVSSGLIVGSKEITYYTPSLARIWAFLAAYNPSGAGSAADSCRVKVRLKALPG